MAEVTVSLSPYKIINGRFMALFMGPKIEEDIVNARGSTRSLPINPDLWKSVEMF